MGTSETKQPVALISGACGDIGRAVVLELARRGAAIAMSDVVPAARAGSTLEALRGLGAPARYDVVDVADAASVERWVKAVKRELGTPALVVAAAATVTLAGAVSVSAERWQRELDVNLSGSFHVAQAAARQMVAAGAGGRIVFVGSWAAHAPHANLAAYSVSKAGVRMLCKCMALELAAAGIAVNEIAPGYVDAGLSAAVFREKPGVREEAIKRVPTRTLITPEDVAKQTAYLCFDASPHTTGTVLLMDGGLSLGMPLVAAPESRP